MGAELGPTLGMGMDSGCWCLWHPEVVLEKGRTLGGPPEWVPNPGMVPKQGHTLDGILEPRMVPKQVGTPDGPQAVRHPRWSPRARDGPQEPGMVPKQGGILDGPQWQGWSSRAQDGSGDSKIVPETPRWSPNRATPQMVPSSQYGLQDPTMIAKQGCTLDGPYAQGWSLRSQGGPQARMHLGWSP